MAYRAEIEIGVKGANKLEQLQTRIDNLAKKITSINDASVFDPIDPKLIQSIKNYSNALDVAAGNLKNVELGTKEETEAVKQYVQVLGQVNTARARQNKLIDQQIAKQTAAARTIRPGETGFTSEQMAPALPPSLRRVGTISTSWGKALEELEGISQELKQVADAKQGQIKRNWAQFFEETNEIAAGLNANRSANEAQIKRNWSVFFTQANELAEELSTGKAAKQAQIKRNWAQFFDEANEISVQLKGSAEAKRLNIQKNWNAFFKEAADIAKDLKQQAARVSLRAQERSIFVEETISRGRSARIARERSAFLQGSSGQQQFGPLAGPGSLGFPVALPGLTAQEQKGLQIAKEKLEIIRRTVKQRAELKNLAQGLQKLDVKAKVAIADANRQQARLNQQKQKELQLEKQIADLQKARAKRRREAAGSAIIGGAFPLLFGQGPGAALGGGIGGAAGGLIGGQFGFGLSLVGTQLGVIVDQFIGNISRLTASLQEPTKALEVLSEAGIKVSKSTAFQIRQLENAGRAYDAQALLLNTLADKLGNEGVAQLQAYQDAQKATEQALSDVQTTLIIELLPALTLAAQGVSLFAQALKTITDVELPFKGKTNLLAEGVKGFTLNTLIPGAGPAAGIVGRLLGGVLPKPQRQAPKLTPEQQFQELSRAGQTSATDISARITELQTKNLEANNDLLNSAVVIREKNIIKLQEQLAYEKLSLDIAGKSLDADGEAAARRKIAADSAKASAALDKRVNDALEAQNKKLTARNRKLDAANAAALNAERRAKNFTAELEIQLRLLRVAGSTEARKQQVELAYQRTVARISNLKNQDYAVQQKALADQIRQVSLANIEAETQQKTAAAIRAATAPIRNIREEQESNLAATKEYERLLMEGVLPSEAKRISEFNKQVELQLKQQAELIKVTELDILRAKANGASTKALEEQLELYKKQQKAIEAEASKGPGDQQKSASKTIESRVAELKGEITELTNLGNLSVRIAENIGVAFSSAFQDVINGSKSVQEALSDVFKSIGESFVQMAAEIIQRQIQMIILQTILKALGAVAGTGGGGDIKGTPPGLPFFEARTPGLATGGPVQPNRPYMVGEQGPELFTPNQAGRISSTSETRSLLGRSPVGNAPAMNFTFETTNIGGQEFVSREQLEAAMAVTRKQAANDGARKGMGMTLDKMQHSPATRRRVGIS